MTRLSVNVNKIALLRNARTSGIPDVVRLAEIALNAGANGITVHPRPDERHILATDVRALATMVSSRTDVEYNIEGNPFHEVLELIDEVRPDQCTLVPDDPSAFTSDHGWDLAKDGCRLQPVIARLRKLGTRVSLFMDPVPEHMQAARDVGADRVELYTESYATVYDSTERDAAIARYSAAARAALEAGLGVNAGHDLNCKNLPAFIRGVPDVAEVSIGHALTADALEFGMAETVRRYLDAIGQGVAKQ